MNDKNVHANEDKTTLNKWKGCLCMQTKFPDIISYECPDLEKASKEKIDLQK